VVSELRRWSAAVLLALAACSGGDPEEVAPLSSAPGEDGAPSEVALGARDELALPPDGYEDCGTIAADSGWPTTVMPGPRAATCLVRAFETGVPTVLTLTGRDGAGAAIVTQFLVVDGQRVEVHRTVIAPDGATTATRSDCSPSPGEWLVSIDGTLQVLGAGAPCRGASG
jgi:hypothetical protein